MTESELIRIPAKELIRLTGSNVVRCPECDHGIDPHGIDPGGPCGVGNEQRELCQCLMSPNGIADRLQRQVDAVRAVIDHYRDDVTADQIRRALDGDPS